MCLDIDPDSVIHKHLVNKLYNKYMLRPLNSAIITLAKLKMLPSFHISLGRPPQTEEELKVYEEYKSHTIDPKKVVPVIGDITLAPINISKKDGKKSAWIPLDAEWFVKLFWLSQDPTFCPEYELNLTHFKPYPYEENYKPSRTLHISLANLTGNPHSSIARPEDCIIDTITL